MTRINDAGKTINRPPPPMLSDFPQPPTLLRPIENPPLLLITAPHGMTFIIHLIVAVHFNHYLIKTR